MNCNDSYQTNFQQKFSQGYNRFVIGRNGSTNGFFEPQRTTEESRGSLGKTKTLIVLSSVFLCALLFLCGS